ncbi:MAG: hypothetical protein GY858_08615 [Candidatus Omnitrophica bacterium]|nr:hypothetical protein [Candidatus Omnitrophota bacterium]
MITYQDFSKLELRVGKVLEVSDHPDADRLYVLKVDIGEKQVQLVAGIKQFYAPEDLENKLVVVLGNLEPKTVRGVESCGMLLAAKGGEKLTVLTTDTKVEPGSTVG